MVIHPDKTKAMIITTRQKHQLSHPKLDLYIGNKPIQQVNSHKILGVHLDCHLNWQMHINNLAKRLAKSIFLFSKIKIYVNPECLKLYFSAHMLSHISYSSTIWDGCCKDTFSKINRLYRRAIKILSPVKNITTEEKMKLLNIIPLNLHLKCNKAQLFHKIYNDTTPSYLKNLVKKSPQKIRFNTHSTSFT